MISGWYMASTANIAERYDQTIGAIQGIKRGSPGGNIHRVRLNRGVPWCLDNGVFTGVFDKENWLKKLEVLQEYKATCLFVTVPDIVGDFINTLARFLYYRPLIENYPVAFVSQDGIMNYPDKIPWDAFDCLFVGGSDDHKRGREGGWIIAEAQKRGKWVHVGRINSPSSILRFWMADSWDGTTTSFAPSNIKQIHPAVLQARALKKARKLI